MADVTFILTQIERGDPIAAEQLLPLVYEELRKLAAARLAQERPGQTLQATALVHEAYLRLVGNGDRKSEMAAAPTDERRPSCTARTHRPLKLASTRHQSGTAGRISLPPRPKRCGGS